MEEVIDRMKRVMNFFKDISEEIRISKREFLLTIAVCVLGGIVVGMIGSPRKKQVIGSHNGNGWWPVEEDENDDKSEED